MLQALSGRNHRHSSIFDLDCSFGSPTPNSSSPVSSSTSEESLQFTSSSGRRHRVSHLGDKAGRRESYNARIFRGMRMAGERPVADDVLNTRREARDSFADGKCREERRRSIEDALCTLDELANFVPSETNDEEQMHFVYELSAFVSWAYSTMRFCGFVSELNDHFADLKEHFRRLLPSLPLQHEIRFLATLRFSALCLEYAEMCDEEAVNWCRDSVRDLAGIIRAKTVQLSSSGDCLDLEREVRRLSDVADRLDHNIDLIKEAWSRAPPLQLSEKLV